MKDYQERVVKEKEELDIRAKALSDFIGNNTDFESLEEAEAELMREQCEVMWQLSEILGKRIDLFK